MIGWIFGGLAGLSLLYGLICGEGAAVASAMLSGAQQGVETAFAMAGGFAFFCGMIGILKRAGTLRVLTRFFAPILRRLLGSGLPERALAPAAMNIVANLLGLGNAATPMGIEAAKCMAAGERAGNALCLFLVINASSVQLLPSSVIALRLAAGAANPGDITLPTFLATFISLIAGISACKAAERMRP